MAVSTEVSTLTSPPEGDIHPAGAQDAATDTLVIGVATTFERVAMPVLGFGCNQPALGIDGRELGKLRYVDLDDVRARVPQKVQGRCKERGNMFIHVLKNHGLRHELFFVGAETAQRCRPEIGLNVSQIDRRRS